MKKLSLILALLVITPLVCEARVNVLETWYPGLDMTTGDPYSYRFEGRFIAGEHFIEIPAELTYVATQNVEIGGRWGIKSQSGNQGIDDLMIGAKYVFTKETDEVPSVAGETAVTLPTGNFSEGLGTGSADFLMQWLAKKRFSKVDGTFGLGIRLNAENSDNFTPGNVFFYQIGASKPYDKDTTIYCELKGANHNTDKINGNTITGSDYQELYLAPGVDYLFQKKWKVNSSLLIGLTSRSSTLGFLVNTKF